MEKKSVSVIVMMLILVSIFVSEFSIYPVGAETVVLPLPLDLREGLERQAQYMHTHDPIEPSVSIYTDKYTYHASDTMHLGLDIYNPLDDPVTVCVAIWLERPVSPIVVILHDHAVTLPAGFTYSNQDFKIFVLPPLPAGTYTWHAALLDPATHTIFVEDTAEWQFGVAAVEYWAVLVGIEDYMYINDCAWADNDAIDTRNVLLSYPATPWTADHIILLVDYDGTKANIQSAIDWMGTNAGPEDTCIFQFAGHGSYSIDVYPVDEVDGYDEYICPADTTGSSATMISDDELTAWLDEIDAKKVVWLDSCFSGGFVKADELAPRTWKGVPHVQLTDGFSRDLDKTGYVVSTACDEDELAWGHPKVENGIFTYFLVQGLLGPADINSDDKISAEEAFAYANPLVLATGYETPQIWDGIEGEVTVVSE